MSIFPSESLNAYNEFKTEFEKIGVNTIRPFMVNSEWLFNYKNKDYSCLSWFVNQSAVAYTMERYA